MTSDKPPPRTLAPEDERKVQEFLERAAPVVLQSRVLDAHRWGELVALAEELELSDEQLQTTVHDLKQRGVIEKIDLSPPKPPPLPKRNAAQPAKPPDAPAVPAQEDDFSLTPPAPPPRATSETELLPEVERRKRFVDQARMIIGEQRGLGPKAQSLITATAEELGLNDRQMREALQEVVREQHQEPDDETRRSTRWRVEGQPIPEPTPPQKKPSETFREFVDKSLEKFAGEDSVSEDLEDGIIKHGTKVLRLSQVYARHLVHEVAEARELRVASVAAGEAEEQDEPGEQDTLVRRFGERAAPILAQHRGLNTKSRVLLAAVAHEIGISEPQMEQAIAALQQEHADGSGVDAIQRERLELFRIFLRNSMQKLPRGVLTPNVEAAFLESGENLHGVAAELVRPTIREVAAELQLSVITEAQAQQHVESLVQQKLGDTFVLNSDVRERIQFEGEQWGLSANQVDAIIRANTHSNYRRRRSEQNFTNLALLAASIAVLLVISFLGWAMLGGAMVPRKPARDAGPAEPELPTTTPGPVLDRDDTWWDEDLSIAAANVRIEFPLLRRTINDIASRDPAVRTIAYEKLVGHFFQHTSSDLHRAIFLELLSRCYALDPHVEPAERLARVLLADVPGPDDRLSDDAKIYANVFWALRVAVAALSENTISADRAARLSVSLGRVLGASIDHQRNRRELEQVCLGALAERFYRLLIASVESRPAAVDGLHRVIAKEAARYLDRAILDKLNADFLAAALAATTDDWRRYEALLVETVGSLDPLAVMRMVDLYETTDSEDLQRFMAGLLLRRTGATPESFTVAEIAREVRTSLGVTDAARGDGRWVKFSRAADSELAQPRADPKNGSEFFREITRLARLSTMGCALAQQVSGQAAFDAMYDRPADEAEEGAAAAEVSSGLRRMFSESELRQLERALLALTHERTQQGVARRAQHVQSLANLAERVGYLSPIYAQPLAQYLLRDKLKNEHENVMSHIEALALWKNLRLAIADQLGEATLDRPRLLDLVNAVLGDAFALPGGDHAQLRVALLQSVRRELSGSGPPAVGKDAYDRGRQALLKLYQKQAELLGVPRTDYGDATRPSLVLRAMIEHRAGLANVGALPVELRRILADLPHQLIAIEYVATDDLRRTVMLERLWLHVLSIEAARSSARKTGQALGLVAQVGESGRPAMKSDVVGLDAADDNTLRLLAQLRDGQVALLKMWRLITKPS